MPVDNHLPVNDGTWAPTVNIPIPPIFVSYPSEEITKLDTIIQLLNRIIELMQMGK